MSYAEEWARCRPWIEKALRRCGGTHDIEDIERGLSLHLYQFWPGAHVAVVTEVNQYPKMAVLNCFLIGGDSNEALVELVTEIEPRIAHFARNAGCNRITGIGRQGFRKVFEGAGYTPRWFVIAKDL
ncbi:MAG: hypothetical protein V4454_18885 [Pseudomonadota bacterium]